MAEDEKFILKQSYIKSDSYPPPRRLESEDLELMKHAYVEKNESLFGIQKIV